MIAKLSFEEFLDLHDDDIYCEYMETGAYYDTEREDFDEWVYEAYLRDEGQWKGRV